MNLLNVIIKQIKINYKLFSFINIIFFIILFFYFNSFKIQNLKKNNYKIILNYEKDLFFNRFDITSFSNKPLFNNFKENMIYLEKQYFFDNQNIYYLFILNNNVTEANNHFKEIFNIFNSNYLTEKKKTSSNIIDMLNYNKDLEIKLLENNKDFNCNDIKKSEEMIKTCSLIKEYKNIDQKNKTILENLKNTGLDYEILAESQKLSSLNLRKQYELSIIIFLYLIMNFLTIFEKKVFYKD